MKFFNKLEQKYRRRAIRNLMYYIIMAYGAGILLDMFMPGFYATYLSLDMEQVFRGQVWRLVTYIIYPPFGSVRGITDVLLNLIILSLYYSIGQTLENVWGAFRFNVYFFMGVVGNVLGALVAYLIAGQPMLLTTEFLNLSLFFAFAATFPNTEFYLMFVLPVKAKWLAVFDGIFFLWAFIKADSLASRLEIGLALANFAIFFLMTRNYHKISPKELQRKRKFRAQAAAKPQGETHHRCAVCGRTEKDGDHLEFRYCSKCAGSFEYCQDHLYTHQHVSQDAVEDKKSQGHKA